MGNTCFPRIQEYDQGTWIQGEEICYPYGDKRRRGRARHKDTGKLVAFRAGIPDTFFTIPCRGGGYLYFEDEVLMYAPSKK